MALDLGGVRWLFFDLGYTLIDEDAAADGRLRQLAAALGERGISASAADLRRALERASARFDPNPFASVMRTFTDDEGIIAHARRSGRYPKELERLYPGVDAMLGRLGERYELGIIANQPPGTAERLRAYGIARHFKVCASSGDVGAAKPDAAIFRLALADAGCDAPAAVMIGDRLDNDIAPAKALGFGTARVMQGPGRLQRPRTAAETPDATASSLAELEAMLLG